MTTAYEKVKKWRVKNREKWNRQRGEYNKRRADTVRARRRRYYALHKEARKRERLERKLRIILFIDEYKTSTGCCFCAENFPAALDFHHLGDKEANISQTALRSWSLDRVKVEMDKCILMCSNCHRKLHAGFLSID